MPQTPGLVRAEATSGLAFYVGTALKSGSQLPALTFDIQGECNFQFVTASLGIVKAR